MNVPVSMLSLTIQSPLSSRLSAGNCSRPGSVTSYTSPGTISPDETYLPAVTELVLVYLNPDPDPEKLTKAVPKNTDIAFEPGDLP